MKTTLLLGMLLALCFTLVGCSKDAEVNAFTTDFEKTTNDMTAKIEANPTAAGVDEAQKVLDGKKAELKTKFDAIKDAVGIQVSAETKKNLEDGMKRSGDKLVSAAGKITDPAAATKFAKLMKDWGDIVGAGAAAK